MRKIAGILALVVLGWAAQAQQLENSGFENWVKTDLFESPLGWTSSNEFSAPIGPIGVSADSLSSEGFVSARIISTLIGFAAQPYAGFIVNGKMNVTGHYDVDSIYKAGEPFTGRPTALLGYYRYTSEAVIEDWGHAFVLLKKYNPATGGIDTVGFGSNELLNPSEEFKEFSVPITYFRDDVEPDSIVVAFFSTYPKNPLAGGKLWVDELRLDYATGTGDPGSGEEVILYPNPAHDRLFISGPKPNFIRVFNTQGKIVLEQEGSGPINISQMPAGVYFLQMETPQGIVSKRFVK